MRYLKLTVACLVVFTAGYHHTQPQLQPQTMALQLPAPIVQTCTSVDGLPDPICTPGAVRTTDVQSICNGGPTSQYRPPTSYTNPLKRLGIANYGYADTNMADYEEDHLISLTFPM